jgi:hypothetical protein
LLALAWIVFPAALAVIALGCGLLLERAAGARLPGALLMPAGLAVVIVAGVITTLTSGTARLTTPAVVVLALAGFCLSYRRPRRLDWWALAVCVAIFAVYAAPIVLSGTATFGGYLKLDDTATWLGITDRIMDHGRSTAGLAPSSYEASLQFFLVKSGYPVGSLLPVGIGHDLVRQDVAWLYQPTIALFGAMLALSIYALVEPLVESRRLRAVVAAVAAQPALLYGYSLWGGVKEVLAAALIVLLAALVPPLLEARVGIRSVFLAAGTSAALIGSLSVGGAIWLLPILLPVLVVAALRVRRRLTRAQVVRIATIGALAVVLAVPSLVLASGFLHETSLTAKDERGVLVHPLSVLQVLGVWPNGDLRFWPSNKAATFVLIALVVAAALVGLAYAVRRRAFGLPIYVGAAVLACAVIVVAGSPWVGAKALATASPAFLAAAMACVALFFREGRRVEAIVLGAVIAGGVLWSNALAYRSVWLAPRDQLAELQTIESRFAGEGPTLMTEYQPYGARHFLRRMDPESASEYRRRPILLRSGLDVPKGGFADIDEFQLGGILVYRTLVLGRSPLASRPPSSYNLLRNGRFYEVWQRSGLRSIVRHVPVQAGLEPAGIPRCSVVRSLVAYAERVGGLVATVERPAATVLDLSRTRHPLSWLSDSPRLALYPTGDGTAYGRVGVPAGGSYGVWMEGSWPGGLHVLVDGRPVGSARARLDHPGQFTPIGGVQLSRGNHDVELRYEGADWRPGSAADFVNPLALSMGPLVLSPVDEPLPVSFVPPADAGSLCGKRLDWLEVVR